VRNIYPLSTLGSQLKLRKVLLSEASGNPNLLIFAQNKLLENVRERMIVKRGDRNGKQSFKKHLLDLERIKREERDVSKKVESYNKGEIQKVGQLIGEFRTEDVPERSKSEMRAPRVESLNSEEETREFDM
jgi:hypothetical protein